MAAQKQLKLPRKKTVNVRLNTLEKIRKKSLRLSVLHLGTIIILIADYSGLPLLFHCIFYLY